METHSCVIGKWNRWTEGDPTNKNEKNTAVSLASETAEERA